MQYSGNPIGEDFCTAKACLLSSCHIGHQIWHLPIFHLIQTYNPDIYISIVPRYLVWYTMLLQYGSSWITHEGVRHTHSLIIANDADIAKNRTGEKYMMKLELQPQSLGE